jgi:membrane associated rhomboid family serine protease/pSer/pThr/pTyr-binding forkhead associated (FHA) protein
MIEAKCGCGRVWARAESAPQAARECPECGAELLLACAETLPPGAGAGDFDAVLDVVGGPEEVRRRVFLGGVAEIPVGKTSGVPLRAGKMVSRHHCTLRRLDFGPSRWAVADNRSTNGLFVNGQRVPETVELNDGDVVRVGEYELRFGHVAEDAQVVTAAVVATSVVAGNGSAGGLAIGGGATCPSCDRALPTRAKICVQCGIKVDSGRPVLVKGETDENVVHGNARGVIALVSWIVPFTPLPIPLASEAHGSRRPWAIRAIAGLTCVVSVIFLIATWNGRGFDYPMKNLELWPPDGVSVTDLIGYSSDPADGEEDEDTGLESSEQSGAPGRASTPHAGDGLRQFLGRLDAGRRAKYDHIRSTLRRHGRETEADLDRRAAVELVARERVGDPGEFAPHQLLTHALLHDNSGVIGFALHLGGNMLFLMVFGGRVNALLGNALTAVIYPVLAVGAAAVQLAVASPGGPMLGASGAVMGMAGMYLVLFPVHRVYCGMWVRVRIWSWIKIFAVRGFWVLLIYFAYDAAMVALKVSSGTAHWAHLGGFSLGVLTALGLLASRRVNCGGSDLLSVTLGKRAWPLIGKPGRWTVTAARTGAAA